MSNNQYSSDQFERFAIFFFFNDAYEAKILKINEKAKYKQKILFVSQNICMGQKK